MDKQQVLISVSGWSKGEGDSEAADTVRLLTTGTLTEAQDGWHIQYVETQPDNQASDVTLTLKGGVVTMERSGAFSTSMVFEKGCRFEGSYETPYGALAMGVYPTQVKYQVDDTANGQVSLQYQLDLQGQFAAMHELQIRFCPAGKA